MKRGVVERVYPNALINVRSFEDLGTEVEFQGVRTVVQYPQSKTPALQTEMLTYTPTP